MRFNKTNSIAAAAIASALLASLAPASAQATYYGHYNRPITVYFTRHAEKQTQTGQIGQASNYTTDAEGNYVVLAGDNEKGKQLDQLCAEPDSKGKITCAEELSTLGEARAELLEKWFSSRGITRRIDAVYSSHKKRTMQTVLPTAEAAGLSVQQLPADGTELNPVSTSPSECPTINAILTANAGDTLLVAGHSGTLYDIMGAGGKDCDGLGLDTSNDRRFPMDENGKVRDFGDIWKVVIHNGTARFVYRVNLQPKRLGVNNYSY